MSVGQRRRPRSDSVGAGPESQSREGAIGFRVAVDIGGTFTDLVCIDEGSDELLYSKESTTPQDLSQGVIWTLRRCPVDLSEVRHFVHGSTVVINALLERKGAPTALLTTKGFRDVLEIGRGNRPDMYDSRYAKPKPFIERRLRFEIDERMDHQGRVLRPLSPNDVRTAAAACQDAGISSIAVCYLHSYANPEHERRTRDLLRELFPAVSVTLSHEITREWREFERTSTTVLNAYVRPTAQGYLGLLANRLAHLGVVGLKHAMQSNGGVSTFERASASPIHLVESGPVGGVIGAAVLGHAIGETNVISLDIGGTTAKASLIEGGEVKVNTEYRIESSHRHPGYPIKVPVVDIVEIGSGGGSIARLDSGGAIMVGPASAGAVPGPACYGRGGLQPTLTDAHLVAGRINPGYFLGGEIKLDPGRATEALAGIARRLDLNERETALGIIRVANSNMMNALRMVSVRRGHDPRDFSLVVMGGGSGLHAASLAAELGVRRVIVPTAPAHFSAWGMLMTELRHDYIATRVLPWSTSTFPEIRSAFQTLEEKAHAELAAEGVAEEDVALFRFVDMRYEGQEHTVKVPLQAARLDLSGIADVEERFHGLHELRFTFRLGDPLESVNLHLMALGRLRRPPLRIPVPMDPDPEKAFKGERAVDFDEHGVLQTRTYERDRLVPGIRLAGPLVVEEPASTTIVPPDQHLTVDKFGNLVIARRGADVPDGV